MAAIQMLSTIMAKAIQQESQREPEVLGTLFRHLIEGKLDSCDILMAQRHLHDIDNPPDWYEVVAGGWPQKYQEVGEEALSFFFADVLEKAGLL